VAVLSGTHRYQLDQKGRISLPQRFRDVFREGAWVTLGQDGCLAVYSTEDWERWSGGVDDSPLADRDDRAFARMAFGQAEPVELDSQGRMVIPQRLRREVAIGREAVIVGVRNRMEIWDGEEWDRYLERHSANYRAGDLLPGVGRRKE
jgi:MraZ protein